MTASRCSRCDFVAPSLGQLRKHAAEAHPGAKPRKKKRPVDNPAPATVDNERGLLDSVASLFDAELVAEVLDQAAYDRVLSYLQSRYGSAPEAEAA
jgi:hypothetical protein